MSKALAKAPEQGSADTATMSTLVSSILDDCLYNLISDTVREVHREEKILRMQSAAILAQKSEQTENSEEAEDGSKASARLTEDGKIHLQGNPLKTRPEIICPNCKLPRLLYPTMGKGSRAPEPGKEYCPSHPFIDKPGFDIYGKSLADVKPKKRSKASQESKKQASPNSSGTNPDSPQNEKSADTPVASQIPSTKCPSPTCPRYMSFTRIAQHLDRCLGISGRQSGRDALTKMNSGTPRDSRAGTPKPMAKKRKLEKPNGEDSAEGALKKKKKVLGPNKVSGAKPKEKPPNPNVQRARGAEKRPPGQSPDTKQDEQNEKDEATGEKSRPGSEGPANPAEKE
ncbi:hypothetical protein MMC20_000492 [Loxospora ochrophaea]|nr:hypothetical protein [Loxospora ochrophaea]